MYDERTSNELNEGEDRKMKRNKKGQYSGLDVQIFKTPQSTTHHLLIGTMI